MAKLKNFRRDLAKALDTGEWIRVGDEYDDMEILTRGFTDEYTDMRNAVGRRLAIQRYRGDSTKITNAENRNLTVDCLAEKCLLNVRNLVGDDDQPVTLPAFVEMMRNPEYSDLFNAAIAACANVGRARSADRDDDVKN